MTGKILILYLTALLSSYVFSFIINSYQNQKIHDVIAYAELMSSFLSFLAMTILSIDVWYTFM